MKKLLLVLFWGSKTLADAVCTEMMFQEELWEDIEDNHQVDCLRVPRLQDDNKL